MTSRHHHNANAATWAEARKPRTRPGHSDWIEGVLTGVDAPGGVLTVRVENAGRPSLHAGEELELACQGAIVKPLPADGHASINDLMPGDLLRVELEPSLPSENSGSRADRSASADANSSDGCLLSAHRIIRRGGVGPAARPPED